MGAAVRTASCHLLTATTLSAAQSWSRALSSTSSSTRKLPAPSRPPSSSVPSASGNLWPTERPWPSVPSPNNHVYLPPGTSCAVKVTFCPGAKNGGSTVNRATGLGLRANTGACAPLDQISGTLASAVVTLWPYFTLSKVTRETSPFSVEKIRGG